MTINRNNYEIFFLDYHEGNFDPLLEEELMLFLEQNPDLKEEFEQFEHIPFPPDPRILYDDKDLLKKNPVVSVGPINVSNYHEYFIAAIEGDLPKAAQGMLERFVKRNPPLAAEYELFRKSVLIPDNNIAYQNKAALKKSPALVYFSSNWLYYTSGIAASLLILIWIFLSKPAAITDQQMADNNPAQISTEEPVNNTQEPPTGNDEDNNAESAIRAVEIKSPVEAVTQTATESTTTDIVQGNQAINLDMLAEDILEEDRRLPELQGIISLKGLHTNTTFTLVYEDKRSSSAIPTRERNLYSQFFDYIATAENYRLADANDQIQPENEIVSAKGFKLFGNLFGKGKKKGNSHGPKLNFWTFADIGVYGFNQITHSDLAIDRIRDDEGNIVAYSLLNSDVRVPSGKSKKTRKDQPLYD